MDSQIFKASLLGLFACLSLAAGPARADSVSELDALSRATAEVAPGIALARRQIREGDLTGAMATLERVMLNHPLNDEARLLHASLFCRLDDRTGALIEFDDLQGRDLPDIQWDEATAACEASRSNDRQGG
jgi:hypothetical protein